MGDCAKQSTSELLLTAVDYLQRKNGVSVMQIAQYIGKKQCSNPCQIRGKIKLVLTKAKEMGIMSECKGLYRLEESYEDKFQIEDVRPKNPPGEAEDEEPEGGDGEEPAECIALEKDPNAAEEEQQPEGEAADADDCARDGDENEDEDDDDDDDDGCGDGGDSDRCNDGEEAAAAAEEPAPKKRRTVAGARVRARIGARVDDVDWGACVVRRLRS